MQGLHKGNDYEEQLAIPERMLAAMGKQCARDLTEKMRKEDEEQEHNTRRGRCGIEGAADVAEVYSPPMVGRAAERLGYRRGFALDLGSMREDGTPWNLSRKDRQQDAIRIQDEAEPWLLTASHHCVMCSVAQRTNARMWTEEELKVEMKEAMEHLSFAVYMCLRQARAARRYALEHTVGALTWHTVLANQLYFTRNACKVNFDTCEFGLVTERHGKNVHIRREQES